MPVNVENVLKIADAIEQHSIPDLGFNMRGVLDDGDNVALPNHFNEPCKSVACIAGWAFVLSGGAIEERRESVVWEGAVQWLGMSPFAAHWLFAPDSRLGSFVSIRPAEAVAVLRNLAATGEVDWTMADTVKA